MDIDMGMNMDIDMGIDKDVDVDKNDNTTRTRTRTPDDTKEKGETSIGFMVVGHGVPYQLLQDHVDCAWNMLNDASTHGDTEEGEVVECNFYNDTKNRNFDS